MFASLRTHLLLGTTALVGVMLTGQAVDAQETANLGVSAEVTVECNVTGGTLAFGQYDPADNIDATSSITVQCTGPQEVMVALSPGNNPGTLFRQVSNGPDFIDYGLYTTASRDVFWGDGTNGEGQPQSVTVAGGGTGQAVTVYATLFQDGAKSAGTYEDNVVIDIAF